MTWLQEVKVVLRNYLREAYTDERLAMLLAHARDGKLAYFSCCCFEGVATAMHPLRVDDELDWEGHSKTLLHAWGLSPSDAYAKLGCTQGGRTLVRGTDADVDALRRRRVIPIILAEMRRRERLRLLEEYNQELCETTT